MCIWFIRLLIQLWKTWQNMGLSVSYPSTMSTGPNAQCSYSGRWESFENTERSEVKKYFGPSGKILAKGGFVSPQPAPPTMSTRSYCGESLGLSYTSDPRSAHLFGNLWDSCNTPAEATYKTAFSGREFCSCFMQSFWFFWWLLWESALGKHW